MFNFVDWASKKAITEAGLDKVLMTVNGVSAVIHMPEALKDKEAEQGLPPYAPRFVFPVDEYPECPANWMNGSSKASSYFVPVRENYGMWLDFNGNYSHSHHVAAVLSVQGINPITGQKTNVLRLEQYKDKCPVHDVDFKQDRYCPECKYKWDAQNYISTTGTPRGLLWVDGFRAMDGVVRQYIFTEETSKGVAAQIIGDDRVYAIGIAFYLSKEPKRTVPLRTYSHTELTGDKNYCSLGFAGGYPTLSNPAPVPAAGQHTNSQQDMRGGDIATFKRISIPLERRGRQEAAGGSSASSSSASSEGATTCDFDPMERTSGGLETGGYRGFKEISPRSSLRKKLEVGAGARITQRIYQDPESLDFWQTEPAGMIYLNYVNLDEADRIIAGGKIDTTANGEGFMKAIQVGAG